MSYNTLLKTLDGLRRDAPKTFKTYHPRINDLNGLNQARAKAFIHLFLKVRFGLADFATRHENICDGTQDGGLDAYFIDQDTRTITLLQSKFRTTENNFEEKSIDVTELLRMEVGRISKGEKVDSNGMAFSPRVFGFQKKISEIRDIALYKWRVVILANVHHVNDEQMRRLVDNMDYEVFDFARTYRELVFPLTTGTYFSPAEIVIKINLGKKSHPQLNQDVETSLGVCNIRILYVPTIEIARVMAKYRNALLRYNPRNFLSLSGNEVNVSIKDTVINTTKNEFALRNNGITILAEYSSVTDRTGVSGEGQLIIKDPQILNGGQTATTLAMMSKDQQIGIAAFEAKEVLLKIIERPKGKTEEELADFIESISDATNKQSKIVEADRRSNDPRMTKLQSHFYDMFGLFMERKRGEFYYGIAGKIVAKKDIVDRVDLARALTAYTGEPAKARSSENRIFEEEGFDKLLADIELGQASIAYFALQAISHRSTAISSAGVRYCKYAVVCAVSKLDHAGVEPSKTTQERADILVQHVLGKWNAFEQHIATLATNSGYTTGGVFNYDGYYKGATVAADIQAFSW